MMKKLFASLLVLTMLFAHTCVALSEESVTYAIEPTLLKLGDLTAGEWYESEASRAVFAAFAWMDIVLSDNEELSDTATEAVGADRVYVAKDGLSLYVFFWADDGCLTVQYAPALDTFNAGVVPLERVTDSKAAEFMRELKASGEHFSSYYQVDSEDMYYTLELVLEEIGD